MKRNISTLNSVTRIVIGTMLFLLFWFHTIGSINISDSKNVILIVFLLSVYLLLTGTARICPICELVGLIRR